MCSYKNHLEVTFLIFSCNCLNQGRSHCHQGNRPERPGLLRHLGHHSHPPQLRHRPDLLGQGGHVHRLHRKSLHPPGGGSDLLGAREHRPGAVPPLHLQCLDRHHLRPLRQLSAELGLHGPQLHLLRGAVGARRSAVPSKDRA